MRTSALFVFAACAPFSAATAPAQIDGPDGGDRRDAAQQATDLRDAGAADAATSCAANICVPACAAGEEAIRLHPTEISKSSPAVDGVPAGTPAIVAVGEVGAPDDSRYLTNLGSANRRLTFKLPPLELDPRATIHQLIVGARIRRGAASPPDQSGLQFGLYFRRRAEDAGLTAESDVRTGWRGTTTEFAFETLILPQYPGWTSPDDPRPWKIDDVGEVELMATFNPDSSTNPVELSQIWLDVCYAGP